MNKKDNKSIFKKIIKYLWLLTLSFVFIFITFFIGVSYGLLGEIPSFEELENPRSNLASEIYSSDGYVIGKFYIENRTNVSFENLPDNLVNALIATEDIRFYRHSGIDIKGLFRAVFGVITGNNFGGASTISQQLAKNLFERPRGLSTLQLIGIKIREWVTAVKLERNYSKEEIITMYLNTVDFGSHAFGINSASYTYFKKKPHDLNTEESAILVGMLKAPTYYNPIRNPENSNRRKNVVLGQMLKYDYISTHQFDSLINVSINTSNFQVQDHTSGLATYFREYLRNTLNANEPIEKNFSNKMLYNELRHKWNNDPLYAWIEKTIKADGSKYNIYKDGLKIYTTIDSRMQRYAENAVKTHIGEELQETFYKDWKGRRNAPWDYRMRDSDIENLINILIRRSERYHSLLRKGLTREEIFKTFDKAVEMKLFSWNGEIDTIMTPRDSLIYYQWFLQSGFVAINPHTGHVKAYVGGVNYNHFKFDHATQAKRQVGSTFKPFVYTLAVRDLRYSPCTKVPCVSVTIDLPDGKKWTPKNSGKVPEGEMITLKSALAQSINWVSAFIIKQLSPQAVINLAKNMGITSYVPPVYAISLGVPELTLMELVSAQSTFANGGIHTTPIIVTRIEDKNGNIIQTFLPQTNEALDEETAYVMLEMMKGVVDGGTGTRIRRRYNIYNPIAGKTGTTDNNSDGWFIGLTPELVAGAWVGCQVMQVHFRNTVYGQGANTSLPIWALFMQQVYEDKTIDIRTDDFTRPNRPISIETNCSKYEEKTSHLKKEKTK